MMQKMHSKVFNFMGLTKLIFYESLGLLLGGTSCPPVPTGYEGVSYKT